MLKLNFFMTLICVLVINGCVSNSQNEYAQKIDRISETELLGGTPKPMATLSLDELVKLTKEGLSADQIIEKIKASSAIYDLTPSQSISLSQQGVDNKVLDYIHASHESALQNSFADEINQREKIKQAEIKKLKQQLEQRRLMYDPFCSYGPYGLYPYGAFGSRFGHRSHFGIGFGMPLGCW
jgi:hypothetical protein